MRSAIQDRAINALSLHRNHPHLSKEWYRDL